MLKVFPMPPVPMEIPLAVIRIWIFLSLHTFYLVLYTYISYKKDTAIVLVHLEALEALPRAKIFVTGSAVPSASGFAPVAASGRSVVPSAGCPVASA